MDPATRPLEIMSADPADAGDILALQRLAYQSEARLYGDWDIPPLTQTLAELRAEFATLLVLKAVPGTSGSGIVGSGIPRPQRHLMPSDRRQDDGYCASRFSLFSTTRASAFFSSSTCTGLAT
jgi:hypothetical protein